MGWVKENLVTEGGQVLGLIISGYPPDENTRLSLQNIDNIDQQIYYLENDKINFIDTHTAFEALKLDKLPFKKLLELIRKIKNRKTD